MGLFVDDDTAQMVRDLNVILDRADADEIKQVIRTHAVPRIRYILLTSTDTLGRNVFYGRPTDMGNPEVQRSAEILLDQVLANHTVQAGLRRVAAALACSWMTTKIAALIPEQQTYAIKLEKEALSDLDRFVKSPVLPGVISAIQATVTGQLDEQRLGLGGEVDQDNLDRAGHSGRTYREAQSSGELRLYVDGLASSVAVRAGDPIPELLRKLSLKTIQQAGVMEGQGASRTKIGEVVATDSYQELAGIAATVEGVAYSLSAGVGQIQLQPRSGKNTPASVVNLALVRTDLSGNLLPGVPGLMCGYNQNWSGFRTDGAPLVLVDIKSCAVLAPSDPQVCGHPADLLCFQTTAPLGAGSRLKYMVRQVLPTVRAFAEVTVELPEGSHAPQVVEAIARSLGDRRTTHPVLAGVLPAITVSVDGVQKVCSALDLVAYVTDEQDTRYTLEISQMPDGLVSSLATRAREAVPFTTSLDVVVIWAIRLSRPEVVQLDARGMGGAGIREITPSNRMRDTLDTIRRQGGLA